MMRSAKYFFVLILFVSFGGALCAAPTVEAGVEGDSVTSESDIASENATPPSVPSIPAISPSPPAASDAGKEITSSDFKTDLARIEANLGEVQKSLSTLKNGLEKPTEEPRGSSFVKTYASLFVQCLEERSVELQKGLNDFAVHLGGVLKWKLSWRLWIEMSLVLVGFGVTTFLCILFSMGAHWWLSRFLFNRRNPAFTAVRQLFR